MVKGLTAADIDAAFDAKGGGAISRRLQQWRADNVIPPAEPGDNPAAIPALAAIVFWLFDRAGLCDRETISNTWAYLSRPHHDGQPAPIDLILADVAAGGAPVFVLTQWLRQWDGDVTLTMALRFNDQRAKPIMGPSAAHEPTADIVLELRPLLERYVGANIIPMRTVH